MKRLALFVSTSVAAAATMVAIASPALAATLNLTQYVNPFIGTDDSNSPDPVGGGAGGSTVPGPSSRSAWSSSAPTPPPPPPPATGSATPTSRSSASPTSTGPAAPNNEDLGILPITGNISASPGTSWTSYRATQTKSAEVAQPGYYKAVESNYGNTQVELSTTKRTAIMRLTYPAGTSSRVLINTSKDATGSRSGSINISGSTVTGTFTGGGFCGSSRTYQIFYRIEFDRAPSGVGTWLGGTVSAGSTSTSGTNSGGYLTFDTTEQPGGPGPVSASRSSAWPARRPTSTASRAASRSTPSGRTPSNEWNTILNRVQATGGSATDLQKFYTALYHVFVNPNVESDVNGQYRGFDNAIHTSSRPVYQNYSGWDIYRSWSALIAFIAPDRGGRHRQLHGPRRPAGRPAAEVVAQQRRVLRDDRRPRPDHRDQHVPVRRPQLRHGGGPGADGQELQRRHHPGRPDPRPAERIRPAQLRHRGPVGLAGVLGVATSPSRSSPGRSATPRSTTRTSRAPSGGATSSTPSPATSTSATPTAPGRGRSTRPTRAATPRATPPSTPGWSPTTSPA